MLYMQPSGLHQHVHTLHRTALPDRLSESGWLVWSVGFAGFCIPVGTGLHGSTETSFQGVWLCLASTCQAGTALDVHLSCRLHQCLSLPSLC
jgi:hypothetical protein